MKIPIPVHKVLYTLPVPSDSLLRAPVLQRVRGVFQKTPNMLTISCFMRSEGQSLLEELQFIEPLANAVYSLFAVPDFASIAYDKVVEFPDSDWLREVKGRIESRPSRIDVSGLRHLAAMIGDGPYYDFICRDFAHVRKPERTPRGEPL